MSTKKLSPKQKEYIKSITRKLGRFDEETLDYIDDLMTSLSIINTGKLIIKTVDDCHQPNASDLKAKRDSYETMEKWTDWSKHDLDKVIGSIKKL